MQAGRVIGLDWGAPPPFSGSVSKGAGMPSNGFVWMVHRPNLAAAAATCDTRGLPSVVCARRTADAPSMHNPRGRRLRRRRSERRLSGKRECVPGLSERSCELRYVGIPVIWRRRDAQTLRPTGNGRIIDRLDINGVAL